MASGAVSIVSEKPGLQEVEDLFREHHELVYRTAYSILNNAADAEDVVQSLFLRLVRRLLPPEVRTNVRGYFYRAAVNQSLDIIRSRRRYELVADVESLDTGSDPADGQYLVERLNAVPLFAERMHLLLERALAELSPDAVHILVLRYTHNYSDKQIAALLGTSRTAIAVRLLRARARLKKLMRDSMGEGS
jgi:RNA polymerase sigma-70 factor, ECF subfamily